MTVGLFDDDPNGKNFGLRPSIDNETLHDTTIDREEDTWTVSGSGESGAAANTAWGRIGTSGFDAEEDDVTMDGEVTTRLIGLCEDIGVGRPWMRFGTRMHLSRG